VPVAVADAPPVVAAPVVQELPVAQELAAPKLPSWIPSAPPPLVTPPQAARPAAPAHVPLVPKVEAASVAEVQDAVTEEPVMRNRKGWVRAAAAAGVLVALSTGGVFAARRYFTSGMPSAPTGTLSINSNPPGAQVIVDGDSRGVTPLAVSLKAGSHVVELRGAGEPRTVPVTIAAGSQVSQYIELPKSVNAFGQLQIRTEPAGAQVTVDGIVRGRAPVLVEALAAGEHAVVVESDAATVKQSVTVEAGSTASLVVPMGAAESGPLSGWLAVSAPVEIQILESGRLVGNSQSEKLMVSAGKHEFDLTNDALGFRATKSVQVAPGKTASIKVDLPKGAISVNAQPWAEVWIDGEKMGETPLGNLSLTIGPHEILFRHPEFGEQKYAATVSLKAPTRVSVDMKKK
jgi:hypothetical protein